MNVLIGRTKQVKRLQDHLISPRSEFVAIYGRRRVGKTFLIRKAFDFNFDFQMTGIANVSMKRQLSQFHLSLIKSADDVSDYEPATDWFVAFDQLSELISKRSGKGKKVIFLDELPWLDSRNSKFLSALEHFWNSWASARDDILLIVCGSAASWMLNNLIHNRGGLHNRITDRIKLEPFTLDETEQFLKYKKAVYDRYQTMLLYMVFGGIPFYLERIRPDMSAMQNINELCFASDALFRTEYENLYASLFNKHQRHISIIQALATKSKGLSRQQISDLSGLPNGGGLTRILKELEESGFLRRYRSFGKKERDSLYQLIDLYSLFYLRFIRISNRQDENYWINISETPVFYNWAGYAFEMVCLHHVSEIKEALGIAGVHTSVATWFSPDAQIDLLIDRKDQVINICEMKFSINLYAINKKYAESLRNKLGSFRQVSNTRKALFLTMITTYGLADNMYKGMVQNNLTMDNLFGDRARM